MESTSSDSDEYSGKRGPYCLWESDEDLEIPESTLRNYKKLKSDSSEGEEAAAEEQNFEQFDNEEVEEVEEELCIVEELMEEDNADEESDFEETDELGQVLEEESEVEDDAVEEVFANIISPQQVEANVTPPQPDSSSITHEENTQQSNDDDHQEDDLYEGSSVTLREAIIDFMELYLDNDVTRNCLGGFLKFLQTVLPPDNSMPPTVCQLFKYVEKEAPNFQEKKHFYCDSCKEYSSENKCKKCESTNLETFFYFNFYEVIKYLFEKRSLYTKIAEFEPGPATVIRDIVDGQEYKRANSRPNRGRYDLTFICSVDGVSLPKSSKSHLWPLILTVAEFPAHIRDLFVIPVGLWYSQNTKPNMNVFLQPFVDQMQDLYKNGIKWTHPETGAEIVSRCIAPIWVADAPARAEILNMTYFNGTFGCNNCEIITEGQKYIDTTKKRERTKKRMEAQGLFGDKLNAGRPPDGKMVSVTGLKGTTVLSQLAMMDISKGVISEWLHSMLLGVTFQIAKVLLIKNGSWSLKNKTKEIDDFLLGIRPPSRFRRFPRSIKLLRFYKGTELYNWLFFYSIPILKNYLDNKYLDLWILFVKSMHILTQNEIHVSDLNEAEKNLQKFVEGVKELFGETEMTYNIHQCLHMVRTVKLWGPLFCTSAFTFENFNGFMAKKIHGTKHLGQEFVNFLKIRQNFFLLKGKKLTTFARPNSFTCLRRDELLNVPEEYVNQFNLKNFDISSGKFYARAKINNLIYTSTEYKLTKSNDYTILFENLNSKLLYGEVKVYFSYENNLYILVEVFDVENSKLFLNAKERVILKQIVPIKKKNCYQIIDLTILKLMKHCVRVGDYVIELPPNYHNVF